MARIRTVKPEHWQDKSLPKISLQAHLLWIGIWNFSDDEGVFESDPILLKSQIFPRRTDVRVEQVSQWLDQLVKARYIIPFQHEGEGYYINRTFKTHQRIDKPQASKIPETVIESVINNNSENVPGMVENDHSCRVEERRVKESKGEEGKNARPSFEEFLNYSLEKIKENGLNVSEQAIKMKYDSWVENGWKTGKNTKIINWKSTILNTLPFLEKEKNSAQKIDKPIQKPTGVWDS